jgi:hypothetical protein
MADNIFDRQIIYIDFKKRSFLGLKWVLLCCVSNTICDELIINWRHLYLNLLVWHNDKDHAPSVILYIFVGLDSRSSHARAPWGESGDGRYGKSSFNGQTKPWDCSRFFVGSVLYAGAPGTVTLTASYTEGRITKTASRDILITP